MRSSVALLSQPFFWCTPILLQLAMAEDLIWVSTQLTPCPSVVARRQGPGRVGEVGVLLRRPSRQLLWALAPSVTTCSQNTSHGTLSRTHFTLFTRTAGLQVSQVRLHKTFTHHPHFIHV